MQEVSSNCNKTVRNTRLNIDDLMIATLTNLAETGSFVSVLEQNNQTSNEYVERHIETFLCCDERICFIEAKPKVILQDLKVKCTQYKK